MYSTITPDEAQWQAALNLFPEANLLQSWQWGVANTILGNNVVRTIVERDGTVAGMFSCSIKDAKRGRYLEVPGGPLLDWNDEATLDVIVKQLRAIGHRHNCVFIRIRTQLPDTPKHHQIMHTIRAKESLIHVTADHTTIVDLNRTEDELLSAMRQQTRYEIRRSEKRGINVTRVASLENIERFHALQAETAKRQNFIAPSLEYLRAICTAFGDNAYMYEASKDGVSLNLAIALKFENEIAYFEAASTTDAKKEPGAYAIIWRLMLDAKAEGVASLNLWGTAPAHTPTHRYAGVTTFKRGFGGRDVAYLPAHDIVLQPLRYTITRSIEWARKKRRHL